jgi:hypothetical protein
MIDELREYLEREEREGVHVAGVQPKNGCNKRSTWMKIKRFVYALLSSVSKGEGKPFFISWKKFKNDSLKGGNRYPIKPSDLLRHRYS